MRKKEAVPGTAEEDGAVEDTIPLELLERTEAHSRVIRQLRAKRYALQQRFGDHARRFAEWFVELQQRQKLQQSTEVVSLPPQLEARLDAQLHSGMW